MVDGDDVFTWDAVEAAGQRIAFRVAGPVDAPAMVHVHGFAISGSYLVPTASRLTDRFRVFVPDLPGFGRSPLPPHPMDLADLGECLGAFIDALGIAPATLVANSMGCAVSLELILARNELVDRAVLVGLAGGQNNRPLLRAVGQMARDGLAEPPRLLPVVAPDYLRFGVPRALRLFRAMTRYPAYQRFGDVHVPTMVVLGSEDPLRPSWKRIGQVLHDIPPDVTLVLLQGAAHAINFSHPRELAHAIGQFMADEEIRMDAGNPSSLPVLELKRPT